MIVFYLIELERYETENCEQYLEAFFSIDCSFESPLLRYRKKNSKVSQQLTYFSLMIQSVVVSNAKDFK